MDMSKYRDMFLFETREHLLSMGDLLVALEKSPADEERLDALFRHAHSIKGMAGAMGYQRTAELGHHLEDYLHGFRSNGSLPREAFDRLLAGVDLLEQLVEDIAAERPEREVAAYLSGIAATPEAAAAPAASAVAPPRATTGPSPAEKTLLIAIELAENALVPAARALLALRELEDFGQLLSSIPDEGQLLRGGAVKRLDVRLLTEAPVQTVKERLASMPDVARVSCRQEQARSFRSNLREQTVRVRTGLLDQLINQVGELFTTRYMLQTVCSEVQDPRLGEGLTQLSRQIADLHRQVLKVRLMPFSTLTGRLPRQLRELERTTGKTIALRVEGGNVELDRAILEALADPLMHLVRNAVDHGIEDSGEIRVSAVREKDLVRIEVCDNGRGFDPEAIRRMAVEKGLLSAEQAQELVEQRLYELVCQPGFSTATTLTETSGRGVGMDVVKAMVEQFGGTLQIDSAFGQGTSIQLELPLSVAIIQVLLVACAGETLALPLTRILRTLRVSPQELVSSGRRKGIQLEEEFIPLLSLRKVLQLPHAPLAGDLSVVVSELHGQPVGLVVDRLIGQREIFAKSLAFPFDRMGGISGATLLGDGRVIFIIDPLALLEEIATYKPLPEGEKP